MIFKDEDIWFKQDGATAHTGRLSAEVVEDLLPGYCVVDT